MAAAAPPAGYDPKLSTIVGHGRSTPGLPLTGIQAAAISATDVAATIMMSPSEVYDVLRFGSLCACLTRSGNEALATIDQS